jgi:polyhydroxyalkanoate synthesis repressor PhaR
MSEQRLIKKYPNRRLYDTELSRYITLEDVRALIAGRGDLRVVEQRSGRDITRAVLLQVIAEQEQGEGARLSEDFLAQLIRTYGVTPAGPTSTHLEQSLRQYLQSGAAPGGLRPAI